MVVSAVRDFWTKSTSLCFFHVEDQQQTIFRDQSQKTAKTLQIPMKKYHRARPSQPATFSVSNLTQAHHHHHSRTVILSPYFLKKSSKIIFFSKKKNPSWCATPQLFDRVETLARTFKLTRPPAFPASFRRPASERGVVKLFDCHACHWLRQCSSPVFAQKKIAWVPHKTGYCKRGHQSPLG